ncbi:MAG: tetraacyldisaccharide 4'-kinase [Syntrophorhabdaceae bacterium]|nr:tetraacyldisaccharide 4'-kinase [Syntrophorhabdales bacterium]MBP9561733.1 tetraacyldisaccharide 4'-kinase [Syntrophorhabdaceae bacterium]
MRNAIIKLWNGEQGYLRHLFYIPLFFLALLYKAVISVREWLYAKGIMKTVEAGIYVISVGNISLGGTGKTSVVERLALWLKKKGMKPGIVTRGYKRKRKGTFCVDITRDRATEVGDEAFMLADRTRVPVLVGEKKYEAVRLGIKDFNIDVAIIDDGFQTRNIKKDMEILIVKGGNSINDFNLFPLGPYREPVTAVKRADMLLISNDNHDEYTGFFVLGIPRYRIRYKPAYLYNLKYNVMGHYNIIKDKNILAFSGLGDNESFYRMIKGLGGNLIDTVSFPDHYKYSEKDIEALSRFHGVDFIITTAKDAVKIMDLHIPENLFYLGVELEIEKESEFMENIMSRIGEFKKSRVYRH